MKIQNSRSHTLKVFRFLRILIQLIMHRVSITQKKILKNLDSGMKKMQNLKNTIQRKNTIMIQLEYMISHKKGITIPDIQIRQHL